MKSLGSLGSSLSFAMALRDAEPGLQLLAGVRSKDVLARLLQDAFTCRFQGWTRDRRRRVCEELVLADDAQAVAVRASAGGRAQADACQLFAALVALVKLALAAGNEEGWLEAALSPDFSPKLLPRLSKALAAAVPAWREACVSSLLAPPRLLAASCQVLDAVSSSQDALPGAAAVLCLRVEGTVTRTDCTPPCRDVTVLLDASSLAAAVLECGLLRSRLAAVAGQGQEGRER